VLVFFCRSRFPPKLKAIRMYWDIGMAYSEIPVPRLSKLNPIIHLHDPIVVIQIDNMSVAQLSVAAQLPAARSG
jgi:hypothetical protein